MADYDVGEPLQEAVAAVAVLVERPSKWAAVREGVASLVAQLTESDLAQLARSLGHEPPVPPTFRPQQREPARSVAWSLLWPETVSEVFQQCGGRGVPALRAVAFSSGGTALYLLCRLAARGIEREPFLQDVRQQFPHLALEAQAVMVDALLRQGLLNDSVVGRDTTLDASFAAEVERLSDLPGWQEARTWLHRLEGPANN